MKPLLSPVLSRTLALSMPVALLGLVYVAIAEPLIEDHAADRDAIVRSEDVLARYRRVAQELPPLRAELAALRRDSRSEKQFLSGDNETLMAAQIQNRLKELVAAAQGELQSSQILVPQSEGHLRRIGVRGQMSIPLEGAQSVFRDLESSEPLLFVDAVDIRSEEGSRRRRERGAPQGVLQVRLDIYGYAHVASAATTTTPSANTPSAGAAGPNSAVPAPLRLPPSMAAR